MRNWLQSTARIALNWTGEICWAVASEIRPGGFVMKRTRICRMRMDLEQCLGEAFFPGLVRKNCFSMALL
jgi:hypothetical protein